MVKQMTLRVEHGQHEGRAVLKVGKEIIFAYAPACLGKVPRRRYRVRFLLRPKGGIRAFARSMGGLTLEKHGPVGRCSCCFLPSEWAGKRLTRWVLPW